MSGRTVNVQERRIRPIYDALDTMNNRKAIQEADRVIKKLKQTQDHRQSPQELQNIHNTVKALKSVAYLRSSKLEEACSLLKEVHDTKPIDDHTLKAMSMAYTELNKYEELAEMYESAHKLKPLDEEILVHLFVAYIRLGDPKKQQQTAMALHRLRPVQNQYYFWAVMSLVMQALVSDDKKVADSMLLPLAERMTKKYIHEKRIEAETEIHLYLMVLELEKKYDLALSLLQGELGERIKETISISQKTAEFNLELEKWSIAMIDYKSLLLDEPDNWQYFQGYFKSLLELIKNRDKFENQSTLENLHETSNLNDDIDSDEEETDSNDNETSPPPTIDWTFKAAFDFFEQLSDMEVSITQHLRGPHLAKLGLLLKIHETGFIVSDDMLSRRENGVGSESEHFVLPTAFDLLINYFVKFGAKPSCFLDLRPYFVLLKDSEKLDFIESLRQKVILSGSNSVGRKTLKTPVSPNELSKHSTFLQIYYFFGIPKTFTLKEKIDFVADLIYFYCCGSRLPLVVDVTPNHQGNNNILTSLQQQQHQLQTLDSISNNVDPSASSMKPMVPNITESDKTSSEAPSTFGVLPDNAQKDSFVMNDTASFSLTQPLQQLALPQQLLEQQQQAIFSIMTESDLYQNDHYLLMATKLLLDIWKETGQTHLLWEAIALVCQGVERSPGNYHFKTLLLIMYGTIDAHGPCYPIFESLDVKYVQNDTLGYLVTSTLVRLGHFSSASEIYDAMLNFFLITHRETMEQIVQAYRFGAFSKIPEFHRFRETVENSLQFCTITIERMLLDLTIGSSDHSQAEQSIHHMDIDPKEEGTVWDKLVDNRDFSIMMSWDRDEILYDNDLQRKSFDQEVDWLKVRNWAVRNLVACIRLSKKILFTDDSFKTRGEGASLLNGDASANSDSSVQNGGTNLATLTPVQCTKELYGELKKELTRCEFYADAKINKLLRTFHTIAENRLHIYISAGYAAVFLASMDLLIHFASIREVIQSLMSSETTTEGESCEVSPTTDDASIENTTMPTTTAEAKTASDLQAVKPNLEEELSLFDNLRDKIDTSLHRSRSGLVHLSDDDRHLVHIDHNILEHYVFATEAICCVCVLLGCCKTVIKEIRKITASQSFLSMIPPELSPGSSSSGGATGKGGGGGIHRKNLHKQYLQQFSGSQKEHEQNSSSTQIDSLDPSVYPAHILGSIHRFNDMVNWLYERVNQFHAIIMESEKKVTKIEISDIIEMATSESGKNQNCTSALSKDDDSVTVNQKQEKKPSPERDDDAQVVPENEDVITTTVLPPHHRLDNDHPTGQESPSSSSSENNLKMVVFSQDEWIDTAGIVHDITSAEEAEDKVLLAVHDEMRRMSATIIEEKEKKKKKNSPDDDDDVDKKNIISSSDDIRMTNVEKHDDDDDKATSPSIIERESVQENLQNIEIRSDFNVERMRIILRALWPSLRDSYAQSCREIIAAIRLKQTYLRSLKM